MGYVGVSTVRVGWWVGGWVGGSVFSAVRAPQPSAAES